MESTAAELATLKARVETLERQDRRLKMGGCAVLLLIGSLFLMGQARPSRTVEAEKFILRDSQGRPRLTIGTPHLSGAAVGMQPDEPAIWISGENGVDRAILSSDGLRFADEKGKPLGDYAARGK